MYVASNMHTANKEATGLPIVWKEQYVYELVVKLLFLEARVTLLML